MRDDSKQAAIVTNTVVYYVISLYFVRSGLIYVSDGKLEDAGSDGHFLSMNAGDELSANGFVFGQEHLTLRYNYDREQGFSLRCLSTVLDKWSEENSIPLLRA